MKKFILAACSILSATFAFAQIPNNSFESWTNAGSYSTPDQWDQLNSYTAITGTYTCTQGTPGVPGSYYLKLTSHNITGVGVVPGVATCGVLDTANMQIMPKTGFPYTGRPQSLAGNWQYMGFGGDQGYVAVILTKWNLGTSKRDTIASVKDTLTGMAMFWEAFNINLNYQSAATPDSAMIMLSASGATPANNSYLWVDSLNFYGTAPNAVANVNNNNTCTIYPNPATGSTNVQFYAAKAEDITLSVADVSGKLFYTTTFKAGAGKNTQVLNTTQLPHGVYFIRLTGSSTAVNEKLVVE
jgi:hypothetical protein